MMTVTGTAWITDEGRDTYWLENGAVVAEVQRTDSNEVRIGIKGFDAESDDVTLYMTVAEASRLAHMLGIAVLANEAAAHEAASL